MKLLSKIIDNFDDFQVAIILTWSATGIGILTFVDVAVDRWQPVVEWHISAPG